MRKPPTAELKPVPTQAPQRADVVTLTRKYELITPLFGGGVEAGKTDPLTVISGKGIRGQLRFWWRAVRGGQFDGDLQRMRDAEEMLWGAASDEKKKRPSQVQLVVTDCSNGTEQHPFTVDPKKDANGREMLDRNNNRIPQINGHPEVAPEYAAFSLQPQKAETKQIGWKSKTVRQRVSFTLKLTCPRDREQDLLATLWAWETFGGVGARTRRGFGALKRTDANADLPQNAQSVKRWLENKLGDLKLLPTGCWDNDVPHLSSNIKNYRIGQYRDSRRVIQVWNELINTLKFFRQKRNGDRGRSEWPEPNAIREITRKWSSRHEPPVNPLERFPRAAFGLPIIFHFKERPEDPGEPGDSTLVWDAGDRLASPLILRPLACANGEYVGLAAVLATEPIPPGGLVLEFEEKGKKEWERVSSRVDDVATQIRPLNGQTDVLTAFLNKIAQE